MNRVGLIAAAAATFIAWGCGGDGGEEEVFVPTALAVEADAEMKVGSTVQLRAIGTRDGVERQLVDGVVFTSSDDAVATVDPHGVARILAGGPVTFTASYSGLEAEIGVRARCDYPRFTPEFALGRVMPKLSWPNAWDRHGNYFEFNLEDVYCDAAWKDTTTLHFVLSAGWCPPCHEYTKALSKVYEELEALGMKIVIIEVEDERGLPADSDYARTHIEKLTQGNVPSIAVGDADTLPTSFVKESELLEYFPTEFVVRTRDMRIIADGKRWTSRLPLEQIALNPDADWTKPNSSAFRNKCGPGDEESLENGHPQGAHPLDVGALFGGICEDGPDFFSIDVAGEWTLELAFEHAVGDLDLFVWNPVLDEPLLVDGQIVGSTGTDDVETIRHAGPAVVAVVPFRHASARYKLTLTEH